jgi:hypothetical protein
MAKYYGVILLSKTISTGNLYSLECAIKEKLKSSEEESFFKVIQDISLSDASEKYISNWRSSLDLHIIVWRKSCPILVFQQTDNFIILVDNFTTLEKCNKWVEKIKKINKKGVVMGLNKLKASKDIFEF